MHGQPRISGDFIIPLRGLRRTCIDWVLKYFPHDGRIMVQNSMRALMRNKFTSAKLKEIRYVHLYGHAIDGNQEGTCKFIS